VVIVELRCQTVRKRRFRYWLAKIPVALKRHKRPVKDVLGYRRLA
jgi:hypothetical protein